jgi:hypothetical protein
MIWQRHNSREELRMTADYASQEPEWKKNNNKTEG